MYQVVLQNDPEVLTLQEFVRQDCSSSRIIVSEKRSDRTIQRILVEVQPHHACIWHGFYLRGISCESFRSREKAIEFALEDGYDVFVLNSKTELQGFIKPRLKKE